MKIAPSASRQGWTSFALVAVLLLAATLRLIGIGAGLPLAWNGDEAFIMDHVSAIGADLNPHAFVYGGLTFYVPRTLTWAVSVIASRLPGIRWTASDEYLVVRLLAAGFSTATAVCVFEMGRRLIGPRAGLFGAFLFATSPLAVNLAHYFTSDPQMGFWSALSMVAMTGWLAGNDRASNLAGVAMGLAVGSKYTALVLLMPMAVVAFQRNSSGFDSLSARRRIIFLAATVTGILIFFTVLIFQDRALSLAATWTNTGLLKPVYLQIFQRLILMGSIGAGILFVLTIGVLRNQWLGLQLARFLTSSALTRPILLGFATFLCVAPFTLLDFPSFAQGFFYVMTWQILGNKGALATDSRDFRALDLDPVQGDPFTFIRGVQQEWGWVILFMILLGIFVMWKQARPAFVPFLGIVATTLSVLSFGAYQPLRYAYLLWPIFALLGGMGLDLLVGTLSSRVTQPYLVTGLVAVMLLGFLGMPALDVGTNYLKQDTRNLALEWVEKNVPRSCPILRESDTPEIERVDPDYQVIASDTAFEQTTLGEWRQRGVCLIMIGSRRFDFYNSHEQDFRDVLAQYADLKARWTLAESFVPAASVKGPAIVVYMSPQ